VDCNCRDNNKRSNSATTHCLGEFTTHYQTASLIGFEMVPVERQSAFAESNVSLTLAADSERWSVTAFAKQPAGPNGRMETLTTIPL